MLKTIIVYLHLLATCVALGSVLLTDHRLWHWRHQRLDFGMLTQLAETQAIVTFALIALWISGIGLVGVGYWQDGVHYLLNPKLWAKVSVVSLLTANGVLLHRVGFPLLQQGAFAVLPRVGQIRLCLLGACSSTGWLFAAFLGVARPWNYTLNYLQVMACFGAALLLAVLVAITAAYLIRMQALRSGLRRNIGTLEDSFVR